MLLAGKSVVITGAGSGVGRAASLLFARHGARIVCLDVNQDWVRETEAMIRRENGVAASMRCDVRDYADVSAGVERAVQDYGRLDVMYNNAGVATSAEGKVLSLIEQGDEDFDRLVSINFRGVVHGCQAAARQFLKQGGGGAIVNTASVAGLVGWGGVLYGATKGAVVQLTRGLAIELAPDDIRVNSVCPGGMLTNFGRADGGGFADQTPERIRSYGEAHPLGRPISPEDCANAALFLASDLSSNCTGVLLPVDGGYVAA